MVEGSNLEDLADEIIKTSREKFGEESKERKKLTIYLLKRFREEIIDPYLINVIKEAEYPSLLEEAIFWHLGYDSEGKSLKIGTKGKRWRPTLSILVGRAFGASVRELLPLAGCVELNHNATLVSDDIEDEDRKRRDRDTLWIKYGLHHAVNVADTLYQLARISLSKGRKIFGDKLYGDLVDLTNKHMNEITKGQTKDMCFWERDDVTEMEYNYMVKRKTGDMIANAVVGAATIAGDTKNIQHLEEYSYNTGKSFQMQDDLIDPLEGKGRGGEKGCDIKEGKRTLMVIYAFKNLPEKEKDELTSILDKPRKQTTREDIDRAYELLETCGAFKYVNEKQIELAKKARRTVRNYVPKSAAKDLMMGLTDFLIERKF